MKLQSGNMIISTEEKNITVTRVFSYIKKKDENNNSQVLISSKDLVALKQIQSLKTNISFEGVTMKSNKYPKGITFTCKDAIILRARRRMDYGEYLITCNAILEEKM